MTTPENSAIRPARNTNTAGENGLGTPDLRTRSLQEEISERARKLWECYGRPSGRDEQIWLEAERQLLGADTAVSSSQGAVKKSDLDAAAPTQSSTPAGDERQNERPPDQTRGFQLSSQEMGARKPNAGKGR